MSLITGRQLADAFISAGIVRPEMNVRRVVIDAPIDGFVVIHLECYGDKRCLEVVPALTEVEIRMQAPQLPTGEAS